MLREKYFLILNILLSCQFGRYFCEDQFNSEDSIEFYARENYRDLLYKIDTNDHTKCNNFAGASGIINVGSIKTDQCWILHRDPNCKSLLSEKVVTNVSWENFHRIGSFQRCNKEIGGPSLHLDITTYYEDRNVEPTILESYTDVCTCQSIPEYVQNLDQWSINNFGNDMVAYFEKDCKEDKFQPLYISGGHSKESREIYKLARIDEDQINHSDFQVESLNPFLNGKVNKIQSFGPALNSSYFKNNCLKFHGSVVKFEIDDRAEFEEADLEIEMFNNVFRNNEHSSLRSTYYISKTVEENFHVEMDSTFDDMSTLSVEPDFEVESNFDQNVFREIGFKEALRKAYSKICENSLVNKTTTLNSSKKFAVKQVINIPPCTEHKVNAHVNILKNDGIHFKALMEIRGYIGSREMVAGEVRQFMDSGLEYKWDYDRNTVLAYANGIVGLKFGASLVVEGDDIPIPECVAYNQLLTCPACEVCY